MNIQELVNYILKIVNEKSIKKIYIGGNGASGKTTLAYKIKEELNNKIVNIISTDDFMIDFELRKNAKVVCNVDGKEIIGRYTSSVPGTYYIKNIEEILYNIDNGVDCYYFPLFYKEENNVRKLNSNYDLTIIEGVGTAFLDKKNSLGIYLTCSNEIESERRNKRALTAKNNINYYDDIRTMQYKYYVEPHKDEYNLFIDSYDNYYEIRSIK